MGLNSHKAKVQPCSRGVPGRAGSRGQGSEPGAAPPAAGTHGSRAAREDLGRALAVPGETSPGGSESQEQQRVSQDPSPASWPQLSPPKPRGWENLGRAFTGWALQLRSQQREIRTRRFWSCICKSGCCVGFFFKFFLLMNYLDVLKTRFYKNRRESPNLSQSAFKAQVLFV